jgi:DnaJ-class molecular chaperone
MNILIACEFSGTVRDAFRSRGHKECRTCHGSGEDSQHFWSPGTLYNDGESNSTPIPAACTDCDGYGTFQS